jgi:hypothetical protein
VRTRSRYRQRTRYSGSGGGGLVFQNQLAGFRAARDDAANTPVDVVMIGNSITGGAQSPGLGGPYGGFVTLLGDLLMDDFDPVGDGHGPGWVSCRLSGVDPVWELTNTSGTSAQTLTRGAGRWAVTLVSGDMLTLPAAAGFEFDQAIVCYTQTAGAGSLRVDIDDVEDFTVATANATTQSHQMVSTDPYTYGTHKVELIATGGDIVVDGVFLCRGNHDSGFRVWNCGHSGDEAADVIDNPNSTDILSTLEPALVWWQHFFNDRPASVDYAATLNSAKFIQATRSPSSSLVFVSEYETAVWTVEGRYAAMIAELDARAAANNAAYFKLGEWMRTGGSFGFNGTSDDPCFQIRSDEAHPELAGFEDMADLSFAFLTDAALAVACDAASDPEPSGAPFKAGPIKAVWASDPDWTPPADGQPVPSMLNKGSVAGDPAEATNQPAFRASVTELNGEAGVDFDGSNDHLYVALPGSVSHPCSGVVVIVPQNTADTASAIMGLLSGGASRKLGMNSGGTGLWQISTLTGGQPVVDTPYLLRWRLNDTASGLWVNETEVVSGTVAVGIAPTQFGVGAHYESGSETFSQFFNGIIAFAAMYDYDIDGDADWADDLAFLKVLYNLPIAGGV